MVMMTIIQVHEVSQALNYGSEPKCTNVPAQKLAHLNTVTMNVIRVNYICAFPTCTAANIGLGYEMYYKIMLSVLSFMVNNLAFGFTYSMMA